MIPIINTIKAAILVSDLPWKSELTESLRVVTKLL